MKLMLISTTVFSLPPKGYSGLEWLVYAWANEFQKAGHQVIVVAPQGSQLPEGIELIPTQLGEAEESAYLKYRDRLGEFDCVFDHSWQWFSVISQMQADRQLPICHIYHSDPNFLGSPPPIQYPMVISLSRAQGEIIIRRWGIPTRTVYNGIPLDFYTLPNPETKRGGRYLWLARYTPEKGVLEAVHVAKSCRVPLDMYGDTTIISDRNYPNRVMAECDQRMWVFNEGITREETVKQYQSHKALLHWINYVEVFGLAVCESMACGCPVIARRHGAMPELIRDGKTGFLVDSIEEMIEIIKEDRVREINPLTCRKQAEKFSIEKSAQGYLKIAQEVKNGVYW